MSGRARYYLVSCVGAPNYGDELITATWLRFLNKHAPDAEVIVDCVRPELAWPALSGLHPNMRFADTLWMLCVEELMRGNPDVVEAVTAKIRAADRPAALDDLLGSDVVHLVGGGLLNSLYPWTFGLLAGVVAAAEASGGRSGVTGQGICPQQPDHLDRLRDLMGRLTVADVRDRPSADLLGLRASADDVFIALDPADHRWTDDAPEIMICAQADIAPNYGGGTDAATVGDFLLRTLRAWDVPAVDVGFVECFRELDHQVHDALAERLPGVRFFPLADILRDGLPVRAGQTWISTRFHPHLMAAAAGLGGVAVSVRPDYYDIKHRSLIEQGSGWHLAPIDTAPDRPRDGGFSAAAVEALRQRKTDVAQALYRL